jgi:hypothetical protein
MSPMCWSGWLVILFNLGSRPRLGKKRTFFGRAFLGHLYEHLIQAKTRSTGRRHPGIAGSASAI